MTMSIQPPTTDLKEVIRLLTEQGDRAYAQMQAARKANSQTLQLSTEKSAQTAPMTTATSRWSKEDAKPALNSTCVPTPFSNTGAVMQKPITRLE